MLSGLVAKSRLAPGCARARTSDRCTAFAAAVRMVIRVHDGTADRRADAHVALAAGLADVDQVVVSVADDTDRGAAVDRNHSHLSGGKTKRRVFTFFSHQLSAVACRADHLAAASRLKLNIVYHGTDRDGWERQAVADPDFSFRSAHNLLADLQAFRCEDVALDAILFGSYSMLFTVAGMPSLALRLKSMILYLLLLPPPRCLQVILPWLLRPEFFFRATVRDFSGVLFVISWKSEPDINLLDGV